MVAIKFRAHGKDFHLRLKRDLNTFSDKLVIVGPNGSIEDLDTSHIYEGHLVGKTNNCFTFPNWVLLFESQLRLYIKLA